ncbi:MAG: polysaccharide biosynthesis protein [Flavobacteriaceae bacterium]|nr:MAG: polysaccharide biosynthesis protein [Flavobacteriaceae bacterium]
MALLKKLFKQTLVYGLATVLPRMLSFFLLPIYTGVLDTSGYGKIAVIFAWFAIFNVILAYGMETAFFRFYNGSRDKHQVTSTALLSILGTTLVFLVLGFFLQNAMANITGIDVNYIKYAVYIIALDALVIIPFAWLRAREKPMRYALVKIFNVAINLGLNIFFLLWLPKIIENNPSSIFNRIYKADFEISYIFISMFVSSGVTLLLMIRIYLRRPFVFNVSLWKRMMQYGLPILVAGIAFTINEVFDKILLEQLLDSDIAESEVGKYAACYKLALFMTLFATAFRMGIEPFFFSHSSTRKPQLAYAQITNYFVILGSVILLGVVVFADVLKVAFIQDESYWEAMTIVPIILLAAFFLGIYHNLSVWYKVTDNTIFGAYISLIGAILTIVINYVFIPKIGYMASAIATLSAYGCMMVLSYFFGRKHYPVPYNMRKILFYLMLSIMLSALSFYVFDRNLIIGSVLFVLFLGLVYTLENEKLKKIFLKNED